jgi:hypothetical protein
MKQWRLEVVIIFTLLKSSGLVILQEKKKHRTTTRALQSQNMVSITPNKITQYAGLQKVIATNKHRMKMCTG